MRLSNQTLVSDMKYKLSVTLDEKLLQDLDRILSSGKYRNKSHAVEFAVKKLLKSGQSSTDDITSWEQKNG